MKKPALSSFSLQSFPHPYEQDEISIPRSLFYLSVSSMIISFILLIVSLCDLGYCSLWITPPSCIFTMLYFGGVLFLSRMERTEEDPTYFPTVVFMGYIMTVLWLVCFILTIVVFAAYPHMVQALNYHGLHAATVGLQRFECILCITNLGLVGWFTARAHVIAMQEGNPDHWRKLVEKERQSTRQIRIQHPVNLNDPSSISEPREPPAPPSAPPDWVTAAVIEDNMEAHKRSDPKTPQIEVSSPSSDDVYDEIEISDYYGGQDEKADDNYDEKAGGIYSGHGHFDGADLYYQHQSPPELPYMQGDDADSIYEDSDEKWSSEEEEPEEYHHRLPPPAPLVPGRRS